MRRFVFMLGMLLLLSAPSFAQGTIEGLSPVPTFPLPDPAITPSDLWITQGCVTPAACDYKISPTKLGYIFQGTVAPISPAQLQLWWDTNTSPPILKVFQSSSWVPFPNVSGFAPLNSPAFTGVPTAPTAAVGDTSTQIATDAFVAASQRKKLAADLTMYVSSAGSDTSNDCLSVGIPCATMQHPYDLLRDGYDLAGHNVVISLYNGCTPTCTYVAGFYDPQQLPGQVGPESLTIQGDPSNLDHVVITGVVSVPTDSALANARASYSGNFRLAFVKLQSTSSEIYCSLGGLIQYHDVDFGAATVNQVFANYQGVCFSTGNNTISGGANAHLASGTLGILHGGSGAFPSTTTLIGTPAFVSGFAQCTAGAAIDAPNVTFVGPATGPRYQGSTNCTINTNGAGATYFPGNAGGSVATGAVYN